MPMLHLPPVNIEWSGDSQKGHLRLLDQTRLPTEEAYLDCRTVQGVWDAIKRLAVRGAPAIGIAAAYGCVIAAQEGRLEEGAKHLATSRPTAVNLFWAIDRMRRVGSQDPETLLREAKAIHAEDVAMCRAIGEYGLPLLQAACGFAQTSDVAKGRAVLTHCNAGALATGGIGTATAPMYLAHERGLPLRVYADETRPLLQGARLTSYELAAAGIDVTLICDDMAAHVMRRGDVGAILVGADRIARNGDTANKIGTYNLAVLAKHHGIPFYVAAPSSTFDLTLATGDGIPIEERAAEEITEGFGKRTAPPGSALKTFNPAFDVTPAELITGIISERGVITPVHEANITRMLRS